MAGFVQMIYVYLLFREDVKGNHQQIEQLENSRPKKQLVKLKNSSLEL